MGGGSSDYFRRCSYQKKVDEYVDFIKESYGSTDTKKARSYIQNGGWNARKNGRDLADNPFRCVESFLEGDLSISVDNPNSEGKEWI